MEPAQTSTVGQASRATTPALSMGGCSPGHRKQSKDLLNKFLELGHWVHRQSTPSPCGFTHPCHLLCCCHSDPVQVTTVLIKQVTGVHNLHLPFPCPHKHPDKPHREQVS